MRKLLSVTCSVLLLLTLPFLARAQSQEHSTWGVLKTRYGETDVIEPGEFYNDVINRILSDPLLAGSSILDVVRLPEGDGFFGAGENSGEAFLVYVNGNLSAMRAFAFDSGVGSQLILKDIKDDNIIWEGSPEPDGRARFEPYGVSVGGLARVTVCSAVCNRISRATAKAVNSKRPDIPEDWVYSVVMAVTMYICLNTHLPDVGNIDMDDHWRGEKQFKGGMR